MEKNIFGGKITLNNVDKNQSNLLVEIMDFKKNTKQKNPEKKKRDTPEILNIVFEDREKVFNAFQSEIFQLPPIKSTGRPSDFVFCLKY